MTALLTSREVARLLSVSVRSLERWRVAGIGSRHTRLPKRSIRYRQQDIDAYVAARVVASTSQPLEKQR